MQWRAFWRRFNRGGNSRGELQGILLVFAVLILVRYLFALHTAAGDLARNKTGRFEFLLLAIFMAWMFPLVNRASSDISIRKLLHLPLSALELFCVRLLTFLFPPYAWMILAGSLAILYPISAARNPVTGIMAALCFICFSALTGITIAHLLRFSFFRKLFLTAFILAGSLLVYFGFKQTVLRVSSFLPTALVSRAATGSQSTLALGELALLAAAAFVAALWAFKRSLSATAKPRSLKLKLFAAFRLPGPVGGLAAKDFRYFRRLLDPALGVLTAILGCVYLISAEISSATLLQIIILIVFACNAPLAFNSFGLDNRAAMERLKLMPLTGTTILIGKNLAFVMLVGVQLTPLILLGNWRVGFLVGSICVAEAAAVAAMYLSWGNWMSVSQPFKMQFFQFSSSRGVLVEVIAGIGFCSLPGIIGIYSLRGSEFGALWKIAITLLVSGGFYWFSLTRAGAGFAQKHDRIAATLS